MEIGLVRDLRATVRLGIKLPLSRWRQKGDMDDRFQHGRLPKHGKPDNGSTDLCIGIDVHKCRRTIVDLQLNISMES